MYYRPDLAQTVKSCKYRWTIQRSEVERTLGLQRNNHLERGQWIDRRVNRQEGGQYGSPKIFFHI